MIQRRTAESSGVLLRRLFATLRTPVFVLCVYFWVGRISDMPLSAAHSRQCRHNATWGPQACNKSADGLDGADLSLLCHV